MNLIQRITGRASRRPSTRAQLIALPKAVLIYTDEGSVIVTPQLAKDIQANLAEITKQAEDYEPKCKNTEAIP